MNGNLFVLEGIDGSGKTTQYTNLLARAEKDGFAVTGTTFPNYESPSGRLITQYLSGAFGSHPEDVNAYAAASFYAVDRYASFKTDPWGETIRNGGTVLSARYTTSNAVHQASKLPPEQWPAFFRWLADYEYGLLGLPRPKAVFYLDIPVEVSVAMTAAREQNAGTIRDIHELDTTYLRRCAAAAEAAADFFGWTRIPVTDGGQMRSIEEINDELYRSIRARA